MLSPPLQLAEYYATATVIAPENPDGVRLSVPDNGAEVGLARGTDDSLLVPQRRAENAPRIVQREATRVPGGVRMAFHSLPPFGIG